LGQETETVRREKGRDGDLRSVHAVQNRLKGGKGLTAESPNEEGAGRVCTIEKQAARGEKKGVDFGGKGVHTTSAGGRVPKLNIRPRVLDLKKNLAFSRGGIGERLATLTVG